jgi:hypothetical protein
MIEANAQRTVPKPMTLAGVVLRLIIAWTWVGAPLAWGVYETYLSSKPLFHEAEIKHPEQPSDRASFRGSRGAEGGSDGRRLDA